MTKSVSRVFICALLIWPALPVGAQDEEPLPKWYTVEEKGWAWCTGSFVDEFDRKVPSESEKETLAYRQPEPEFPKDQTEVETTIPLFLLKKESSEGSAAEYTSRVLPYKAVVRFHKIQGTTQPPKIIRIVKKSVSIDTVIARCIPLSNGQIRVHPPSERIKDDRPHPMPHYNSAAASVCGPSKFFDHYYPKEKQEYIESDGLQDGIVGHLQKREPGTTVTNWGWSRPNQKILPAEFLFVDIGKILGDATLRANRHDEKERIIQAAALKENLTPAFEYINEKRPDIRKKIGELTKSRDSLNPTGFSAFETNILLCAIENSDIHKDFFKELNEASAAAQKKNLEPMKKLVGFWRDYIFNFVFPIYLEESGYLTSDKVDVQPRVSFGALQLSAHWLQKRMMTLDQIKERTLMSLYSRFDPEKRDKMMEQARKKVEELQKKLQKEQAEQKKNQKDIFEDEK